MYSETDLERIVGHYRKPVVPKRMGGLSDIKLYPNDILLSYFIAELQLDTNQLTFLLRDLKGLEEWLELCVPKPINNLGLPLLFDGMNYEMPLSCISSTIETRTGKFSIGYDDKLLVADKKRSEFIYPSGYKAEYFMLTNEHSANISIFHGGWGNHILNEIYIRENFVRMMLALMDVVKDDHKYSQYHGQIEHFKDHLIGIVIAHEKSEIDVVKSSNSPKMQLKRELVAEHYSKQFLIKQGVDPKYYTLFHLLREGYDEKRGLNISKIILNHSFHHLA